jgi:ribose 5-phosphate isomerase B
MRISVAADEDTGVAGAVVAQLRDRGHEPVLHGALAAGERDDWAWASEAAARDVAEGRAEQAVVCCWTGTGASIAANKVSGIRAALCGDAETAAGARKWNDANVLALSLRTTSEAVLAEILDAWFGAAPSPDADDRANIEHLDEIGEHWPRGPGSLAGVRPEGETRGRAP